MWVVGDSTVNGSESGSSFKQALFFKELGFNLHDTMIYGKQSFAQPSHTRYHQIFEYMFVFSKGSPKTFNPLKDRKNRWLGRVWGTPRWRDRDGSLKVRDKMETTDEFGMRYNVWTYHQGGVMGSKDDEAHEHPAVFPEGLARDHILSWSNEGDVVLDPFAGSGTTLKEAIILKRNFVGIEISQEYCDLINSRLKPYLEQRRL